SAEISYATDIPLRTVQRVLFRWRMLGMIIRDPQAEGPPSKLTREHLKFILGLLEHSPDLYLDEIKDELWFRFDIGVSLATLCKELKELEITRKVLSKRAYEISVPKRVDYLLEIGSEPAERLVFVDESALNM
ncbi:hypothetical protein BKA62DRAFT_581118, partial [Auriculariales sp. MPI-PUGE-AT-0066]